MSRLRGLGGVAALALGGLMRVVFLGKVAAPLANKMFECGMIP